MSTRKTRRMQIAALALVALLFIAGIAELLRLRFSRGDVFPVYSSYRADPLGTRALYESLELIPGMRVQRWLRETEKLPANLHGTLIYAGMDREIWENMSEADIKRLDKLVRDGTRVVIAFTAGFEERELKRVRRRYHDSDDDGDTFNAHRSKPKKKDTAKTTYRSLGEEWGVTLETQRLTPDKKGNLPDAIPASNQTTQWPATLDWLSELYFKPETDATWQTHYTRAGHPVLISRSLGTGSIVLATDTFFLSNEALQRARATTLLAWLVEPPASNRLILFDEYHLGMEESTGVAALARRYGLAGAIGVAFLLALLWIWQRMALFVPPPRETEHLNGDYDPTAGLEALLRRSIPRNQLVTTSLAEWRKTASAADIDRVTKTLATLPQNTTPTQTTNAIQDALRKR